MSKNFISWIFNKIIIDKTKSTALINEGEVYWCSLGENIGYEQNGKGEDFRRPVLIFKKFNKDLFWGIPMSTKMKDSKYYLKVLLKDVEQSVLLSQLRVLDTKRLDKKIGYISKIDHIRVLLKVIDILFNKI
jgi:mRNA interferase MazF